MQTVNYKYFPLEQGDIVLDLGCGEGRHVIGTYLEENITAIGVDLCLTDLITAKSKSHDFVDESDPEKYFALMQANGMSLPFSDSTFDKIICSEVLEHIPDYEAVLVEIQRVLKPNGLLCASVPRFWPESLCWHLSDEYHENEGGHIRIFLEKQLKRKIIEVGFEYYHRHWAHALHSPYWWMQCWNWQNKSNNRLVKAYHKLLVWDMMKQPKLTRIAEQCLNPVMGKSVVMYFKKAV